MRRVKVLQFPIAAFNGGITHYAVENWRWLAKDRFQCDFATMSRNLPFADESKKMGAENYYISTYAEDNIESRVLERNPITMEYDMYCISNKNK